MTEKVKRLGKFVRETRIAQGIKTSRELADRAGIGTSYISNIERGYINPKRGPVIPSDEVLESLATGLRIPVADLHAQLGRFDEEDEPDIPQIFRDNPAELRSLLYLFEEASVAEVRLFVKLTGEMMEMIKANKNSK